jgi:molecular chaperone GrpE
MTEHEQSHQKEDPIAEALSQELPKNEAEEYKDKYLRLLAEMENTRKRLQKEKQDMMRFSIDNVIADFLLPMDNLENALKHTQGMSQETLNWARGFEMILEQFKEVLTQNGVSPFSSLGTAFDPHLHEAVEVEETEDGKENIVLQEYIKGYKSGSRIIRPARVKVAKKKAPLQEKNNQESIEE